MHGAVRAAAFSPDDKFLATACGGKTARIFYCEACAPLPELLKLTEKRITRQLTPGELRMYLDVEFLDAPLASRWQFLPQNESMSPRFKMKFFVT